MIFKQNIKSCKKEILLRAQEIRFALYNNVNWLNSTEDNLLNRYMSDKLLNAKMLFNIHKMLFTFAKCFMRMFYPFTHT